MFLAELICSDEQCELVLEAIGELDTLDLLVCEGCGCCLQVVAVSDHEAAELEPLFELARAA
jgi:hypothetical protein